MMIETVYAAGIIEDAPSLSSILGNILSFALSVAGVAAVLSFVVSGVLYVSASGDEARMRGAKNIMVFSAIGVAICLSALVVVRMVAGMV